MGAETTMSRPRRRWCPSFNEAAPRWARKLIGVLIWMLKGMLLQ